MEDWETPDVINSSKAPTYGIAITELKADGKWPKELVHRQVKYLNDIVESDQGKLRRLIKPIEGSRR
ncbi:DDE-type integrase/transposase/recombinase [Agrobacterium rhizogenes]|nr:DDE-type integrase/transposase/recombinase [Rhizobium rhizogenes]